MTRAGAIAPFLAMEMAREAGARQAAGEAIVRLDVGQPAWGAPEAALEAAARALRSEPLGYTDALGAMALRRSIAVWYGDTYGVDVSPGRVVIAPGASGAFQLAFLALFDTGDRVAMASPGYPPYRHILSALGMEAAIVEATLADRLQLTAAALETAAEAGPIKGALVASPANPTGAMLDASAFHALIQAARAHRATLISDEIYHGLTYDGPAATALSAEPDAVVVNSFSKYWAMTGWRVGWLVAPEALVKPIERLAQNLFISPPSIAQAAALAALGARDACEARREAVAANRALLLEALPTLALAPVVPPDGAFYVLVDISRYSRDSMAFCRRALAEAGVALTPGLDFCETRGARWVRIAYPQPRSEIERGLERLAAWLKS